MFDEKKLFFPHQMQQLNILPQQLSCLIIQTRELFFYPHQNTGGASFEIAEKCTSAAPSEKIRATKWQILKARQE